MPSRRVAFRLGGKPYELDRNRIEQDLKHTPPKRVDKYFVLVNGRPYPPKQVLGIALNKPLVSFTTVDASRVLTALGFEVGIVGKETAPRKTESEVLFEEYLNASGLTMFQFEPEMPGTAKRPDYRLVFDGACCLFEVKEFTATPEDFRRGFGAYDPYHPIREKINAAREKFHGLKDHCCCLVLYNREKPLIHLDWQFVYGAMLGNLSIRTPFKQSRAGLVLHEEEAETGFFGGGGKMVRTKDRQPIEPQNTTISAILVLEQFPVGKRRFDTSVAKTERELGRKLTLEEYLEMVEHSRGTERDISLAQLRVVVCQNPYGRKPLSEKLFSGPYDERYGLDKRTGDRITRVFAGEQIVALESSTEREKSPMERIIEESMKKRKAMSEGR
jgi:hypothetical protein